ncbi:MAG: AAA domain-containing protein [Lautropia sp.]|nr:AAA domain-containing protein [Lautropia sp.]
MKISDFPFLDNELVCFCLSIPEKGWNKGLPVEIHHPGAVCLARQGGLVAEGSFQSASADLVSQSQQGHVLWILRDLKEKDRDVRLYLQYLKLSGRAQLDLYILVDELIVRELDSKGLIESSEAESALDWLNRQFLVKRDDDSSSAVAFMSWFDNQGDQNLVLLGMEWRAFLKREEGGVRLMKLARHAGQTPAVSLVEGAVLFTDASVKARLMRPDQQAILDNLATGNRSYLKLWEEYGRLEWEEVRKKYENLGFLRYSKVLPIVGEEWCWALESKDVESVQDFQRRWKNLGFSESDLVEISSSEPFWRHEQDSGDFPARSRSEPVLRGRIRFERKRVLFLPDGRDTRSSGKLPENGYVSYCRAGDEAIRKRRNAAKERIEKRSAMPQLRHLLEGMTPPAPRFRAIRALTPYARESFKGAPTSRQEEALGVALNTPDIALIVGPPGTGKTQVIAALQRRLAEIQDSGGGSVQYQFLISSYQHDAVDNALTRADVFGLPAVRVGGRASSSEPASDPIRDWCQRQQETIRAQIEKRQDTPAELSILDSIKKMIVSLKFSDMTSGERGQRYLDLDSRLQDLDERGIGLSADLKFRWNEFLDSIRKQPSSHPSSANSSLSRRVRAIRSSSCGFQDDGLARVRDLRSALQGSDNLSEKHREFLRSILCLKEPPDEQELEALNRFKEEMLDLLRPDFRPPDIRNAIDRASLALLNDIDEELEVFLHQSRLGVSGVLQGFHDDLAHHPDYMENTLREYAQVVGATCQQAAGYAMASLKSLVRDTPESGISFDTVVIDEAARANPLDLFVPMSMAQRRIVLVGDHRQLPHLVQRSLEDELVERFDLSEEQTRAYEQSLFERLVRQLKNAEKLDGVKRVVMLDTQYRMHPTLGRFISQQFYEPEGLGSIKSGRDPEDFFHTIPGYESRCAVWIDVPEQQGGEERRGFSLCRRAEANRIAAEVRRMIDSGDRDLSIGIISFYRAQSDLILEALKVQGIAADDEGRVQILPEYRRTISGDERIRVGTVDAFQGKEFDVVLLSVVRSRAPVNERNLSEDEREALWNRAYGHLRLANRLNVAMSRQRKLLIAVGDGAMFSEARAGKAVPALAAFRSLCEEEARNV